MKRLLTVIFLASVLSFAIEVAAQAEPFRNLDFESALLPEPSPEGYWGALSHFLALPYWDLQINRAPYDWVLHNDAYWDWAYAAVYDWRAPRYRTGLHHVIEGRVEAVLRAGGWEVPGPGPGPNPEIFAPVSISQVGAVPEDARSIHMLVRTYLDRFTVSLGGEPIPMMPVAQLPDNVTEYAGNVTQFAGTTTALTITAVPSSAGAVTVDAISFSTRPVPEPSSLALGVIAFGGFVWCVARRSRRRR
jgi:hypothetical protein